MVSRLGWLREDWTMFREEAKAGGLWYAIIEQYYYYRAKYHEFADGFDRKFSTDTTGLIHGYERNGETTIVYWPTRAPEFKRIMAELDGIDFAERVFIDIGCGKGRVVLLAAGYPFRRVVGLENLPWLADVANRNLKSYTGPVVADSVEVVLGDAEDYEIPPDDLVVYLFDPFAEDGITQCAKRLAEAGGRTGQRITVLYYSASYARAFRDVGFRLTAEGHARDLPWQIYELSRE